MAEYSINAVARKVSYTGSAGVGPYAFPFEVLTEDDVAVYFNETELIKTTDYTVTVNTNGTGSVTLVTGSGVPTTPDADDLVVIVGARDIERTTDFVTAGDLRATALNEQLDALTIMVQQVAEEVERSVKAPVFDPTGINMILPKQSDRVNAFVAFDANGDISAAVPSDDVTTLAEVATDIKTLADIEDGTDATDAIQTAASISADITTVSGISSDVTAVVADQADIGTVATNLNGSDTIGTVAGSIANVNATGGSIASVNTVAGELGAGQDVTVVAADLEGSNNVGTVASSIANVNATGSNIASVNTVAGELGVGQDVTVVAADLSGTDTVGTVADSILDVNTVAGELGAGQDVTVVAAEISNVETVATNIADVNTVAANVANVNTVAGINADVTAVANIDSDVTAVSNITTDVTSVADNNTNVTTVANNIADVNTVSTDIANVNTVANDLNEAVSEIEVVANNIANVNTVGINITSVNTVAGVSDDVSIVATNVADVTNFADVYLGPKSSDPTLRNDGSALQAGDLYFNTSDNLVNTYDGNEWFTSFATLSGALVAANNLSDLTNVSDARDNLNLGTTNSVQFDSFGVGTSASGASGEIRATGDITAHFSDDRLKTRLGKIEDALKKVCSLDGFYYEPNDTAAELGYESNKQVGVSAQSVNNVLPEAVKPAPISDKYLTVQYEKLVPMLIEAIKELEARVAELELKE